MAIFDHKATRIEPAAVESPVGSLSVPKAVGRRRSWTLEEKMAIVAETQLPGETVATVARRHDMSPDHLLRWAEHAKAGILGRRARRVDKASDAVAEGGFIDLGVFSRDEIQEALGGGSGGCRGIEIELPGPVRVKLPMSTTPVMLADIVRALRTA